MQDKILHPNIQLVFFHLGDVAPKNGPKVKKVAGITRVCQELRPKFFHQKLDHEKGVLT